MTCWKQALFVLVWFRKHEDLAVLGAGFGTKPHPARWSGTALGGIARITVKGWVNETLCVNLGDKQCRTSWLCSP